MTFKCFFTQYPDCVFFGVYDYAFSARTKQNSRDHSIYAVSDIINKIRFVTLLQTL